MLSLGYTSIPRKVTVKEAQLPRLCVDPPRQPPCSYFTCWITTHGEKVGAGLKKVISHGKRKEMLMLRLTPPNHYCRWKIGKSCITWMLEIGVLEGC